MCVKVLVWTVMDPQPLIVLHVKSTIIWMVGNVCHVIIVAIDVMDLMQINVTSMNIISVEMGTTLQVVMSVLLACILVLPVLLLLIAILVGMILRGEIMLPIAGVKTSIRMIMITNNVTNVPLHAGPVIPIFLTIVDRVFMGISWILMELLAPSVTLSVPDVLLGEIIARHVLINIIWMEKAVCLVCILV